MEYDEITRLIEKEIETIYYTVSDAAKVLKVSQSTIRKYIRNGNLKAFKITPRGGWRIREDVLKSFGLGEKNDKDK
jgi:excisionase family DNA binding protein